MTTLLSHPYVQDGLELIGGMLAGAFFGAVIGFVANVVRGVA